MNQWHSYRTARDTFKQSVVSAGGALLESFSHPKLGPKNEELTTDIAILGSPQAPKKLVLVSGTHGVEGHCGSMCQAAILREVNVSKLPKDTAVVLVHAINPYGFAWSRRVDGDGIDVNRNFVDFKNEAPQNRDFTAELASWLTPHPEHKKKTDADLMAWVASRGPISREIVARGQYQYDHAPFFGGRAPSWSREILETVVKRYVLGTSHVCIIDYHSGLGKLGSHQLIGVASAPTEEIKLGRQLWGNRYVAPGGDHSVSYDLDGDLIGGASRLLEGTKIICAAQEFGTLDELSVLEALRIDHAAAFYGVPESQREAHAERMIATFFPYSESWADAVIGGAVSAATPALKWLNGN